MDNKIMTKALEVEQLEQVALDGEVVLLSGEEVQRIPVASTDPNDPLNMPRWRKMGVLVCCCWFSIFSILSISGLGTFLNVLFEMYGRDHTPTEIVGISTYPTMLMTAGSLLLLPVAFVVGRRPVFIAVIIICFVCCITAGSSTTFEGHLVSRIFIGLASGTTETLLPLIISDISYLDERNSYFGLYWSSQNAISSALLLAIPYLVVATSWRWFYWFFAISMGVSLTVAFIFLPETRFSRPPMALSGQVVFTDDFGHTHILSNEEARQRLGALETDTETPQPKRTFIQELKPWSEISPNAFHVWIGGYRKILQTCTSPAVIYALALSSISLGIGIAITLIYSSVLVTDFHWSQSSVGLFNAGSIPASFLAMFYSGWCGDKINIWLARRNNGIHKPEHILLQLIVPVITSVIGLVAIAVPANKPDQYSVWGMVIGWAIYQFSFTCIIILLTTFAAEVIPDCPGAGMVTVVGGKNLISFGATQGIIPMIEKFSYMQTFMILLGIFLGIAAFGVPVYMLNGKWRRATAIQVTATSESEASA